MDYRQAVSITDDAFHLGPNGAALALGRFPVSLKPGEKTLDLGCGSGNNSRAAAIAGARVTAVDASKGMLQQAGRRQGGPPVNYVLSDLDAFLASCDDRSFDFVYSVFALEYVRDIETTFSHCARVLKPGGRFLYCDLHPMVSSSNVVGVTGEQLVATTSYFDEGPREFDWRPAQTSFTFTRFHRTLSTLMTCAVNSGLKLRWIAEPTTDLGSEAAAYYDQTIVDQHVVWDRFPYSLSIVFEV